MIVSKILILFLPLLLLAEANFETGPFHRSPASIPSGSSTSLNLPANRRIPSPPKLPHDNQHTPPSVQVETVALGPTQRTVSVEFATTPPKIDTISRPASIPWSPPKFRASSLNIHTVSQPDIVESVHPEPVIVVTPEKSVSEEPTTLPPKIDTDSPIEIQTPKPGLVQPPNPFHTDYINQNTSSYHVSKPVVSPWRQSKFPSPSVNIHKPSQPDTVESVYVEPVSVATPEKSVSKINTSSSIEIQNSKPGVVQPSYSFHADNIHRDTSPYHVPRTVQSPWTPPKLQTPSVNIQTVSQVNKSASMDPATLPLKIDTDSHIEIQTPKPGQVQPSHPFHINNINWVNGPYHVPKPVSSPWNPQKFPAPSLNIHTVSQPDIVESVHAEPVIVVTPEKSVSEEPATLPPKIDTDSPIEIQTPKSGLVQPPNPFHTDYINQNTSPYHVSKPVVSPWGRIKFSSPSVHIHKPSQPDTVESVNVEPVSVITPEKSVSVYPSNLSPKINTDSPIENQNSKPGVVQPSYSFHADNIHRDTSPYHFPRTVQSPWTPPKLQTPSVNIQTVSQVKKSASMDPATLPLKIDTDSHIEIQTPKPGQVQPSHPFHINNINWVNGPYHVPKPVSSPWNPQKFPAPSLNIHTVSQPDIVESVHAEPVIVVTPEKSVSEEPATLPPKIDTDSPIEIQTPKSGLVQPPNPFHTDYINQNTSPYHVSKPVVSPWGRIKFSSPSVHIHKPSQPDTVESVNVEPVSVITPEKSVSVYPSNLSPKINTDSPIENQNSKPGVVQPSYSFHVDNIHRDTSPYHVPRTVQSPWTPPKFQTPSVNIQTVSQLNKTVSMDPATLPLKIDTDSHIEIQTPKPGLVLPPHPFHINNVNWINGPYHVPKPVSSPWTPPKFDKVPSINIHRASQPNTLPFGHVTHARYVYPTPPTVSQVPTNKTLVQDVSVDPSSDLKKFSTDELVEIQTPETSSSNSIPRPAPSPRIPNKPSSNSSEEILSASQAVYTDKGNRKDIGPYHRSQRSADPWEQHTWEEDQISQNKSPPALSTESPESNLRRFVCPQAYGYFKYTNKCSEYIECKNYKPLAYTCPIGLYFNPRAKWTENPCDRPSNVQCGKETIPLPTTASPPTNTLPLKVVTTPRPNNQKHNFRCPQRHGYFKFNDKCGQYIECKNYVALKFSCPAGLHFNPRAEWTAYPCEDPSVVQCNSEPNDEKTQRPTEAPTTTAVQPTPSIRPPPPTTMSPPPPPTSRLPPRPPTTRRPTSPPTITWRPRPPTTRQPPLLPPTTRSPPLPISKSPPPPPPPTISWRPRPPTTRPTPPTTRQPPTPPTTRQPPTPPPPPTSRSPPPQPTTRPTPPPTTSPLPVITPGPKNQPDYNICPQQFGYFRFSNHCGEYIECKNYVPLIFTCPVGLQFNPLADWTEYPCDHPSKVHCNEESVDPKVPSTTQPPPATTIQIPVVTTPQSGSKLLDFECPEAYGYFEFNDQCSEYIECKGYRAMQRFCPAGLHFDSKTQWPKFPCNYPSKVQCDKEPGTKQPTQNPNVTPRLTRLPVVPPRPTIATPAPTIVTQSPTAVKPYLPRFPIQGTVRTSTERPSFELIDYYCREPNGYYAVASQCDSYIECQGYRAMQRFCPAGLHFDSKTQWPKFPCNYPSKVQCDKETGTKQPTQNPNVTPRPTRPPVVPPRPTIATPAPTIVTQSPTAVTPYLPRFPNQGTVRPSTERPSFELIDYYCREPNGYYAVASQCDSYIECQGYRAMQRFCPAGLHFDSKAQWPKFPCNYPSIVQCDKKPGQKQPTEHPNVKPRPMRPTVATPRSIVVTRSLPHFPTQGPVYPTTPSPSRPPVVPPRPNFATPEPTIVTQSPTAVTPYLPRFPTQGTVRTSTERPSFELIDYYCREPNGYYAVASQCDSYIECKSNNAIQHFCPAGLHFNSKAQWPNFPCDYPSRVQYKNDSVTDDPRPTIVTPRSTIATSRRPTGPVITRIPRQPPVKPSPSKQPFNFSCPESNGFYSVASQCDAYVECKDGIAMERICPDGLLFNANATWPDYPCGYPSEVTCSSLDLVQQPNPTAECPHREGFFPTDNGDCGEYKVCHAGVAIIKHCPPGLVFNFDKLNTCDWPINVPTCNQARALEGFVCPSPPANENELHVHKYRHGRSCTNFVACQKGHPRLLTCDAGLHFNEETESCVDSDLVMDCDA